MVNTKKVVASLPLPKKKREKHLAMVEKVPIVEEVKGSSFGKGRGKIRVGFSNLELISALKAIDAMYFIPRRRVQRRQSKSL